MGYTHEQWQQRGVSKTVYSLAYPESRVLIASRLSQVDGLMARHERPWEKRQDGMHEGFKMSWIDFAGKANVSIPASLARHFYPCAGASEAIRETLALMRAKGAGLVVFDGEYEGFEAIAVALGMPVAKVQRARWREDLPALWDKGFELFVSNPSSIDGNHWRDFEECAALADVRGGRIHLDVSYLGACERSVPMSLGSESIRSLFFSLSKVFGVYYRRIGGCFAREPNLLLHGNMWFKNLDSLALGESLLKKFSPGELPRAWSKQRQQVMESIAQNQGWSLAGSDVFMLARGRGADLDEWVRAPGFAARVCLTPALAKMMEHGHAA